MYLFVGLLCYTNPYAIRNRFGLEGLTHVHHIYPKALQDHPVLKDYDLDNIHNIVLIPNKKGKRFLHLNSDRLIYDGEPEKYNKYVLSYLDKLYDNLPPRMWEPHLLFTSKVLRRHMRRSSIPWV